MDDKTKKATMNFVDDAMDTMEGFEGINSETLAIPFLTLLQDMSPQVKKQNPAYIEGAEPGMYFNTVSHKLYKSLDLIVLKFEHLYTEWLPDRGGFVGRHDPANAERLAFDKSVYGKWKTEQGNDLTEDYTYFVLDANAPEEGVCILSMTGAKIKTAKQLNRMMTTHIMDDGQRAKPYYLIYTFGNEYRSNDKGDYFVPTFKFKEYINEKIYGLLQPERKALPGKQVDYKQLENTQGGSSAGALASAAPTVEGATGTDAPY